MSSERPMNAPPIPPGRAPTPLMAKASGSPEARAVRDSGEQSRNTASLTHRLRRSPLSRWERVLPLSADFSPLPSGEGVGVRLFPYSFTSPPPPDGTDDPDA